MIQLTRSGTAISLSTWDLADLQREYRKQHCVRLRQFLEPALLRFIQSGVREAEFEERVHLPSGMAAPAASASPWARDVSMKHNVTQSLFDLLLMNDAQLFEAIEAVTACGRIGSFAGTVYRIDPGEDHYDSWHNDVGHSRLVAISINLSTAPFDGGALQIRDAASGQMLHEVANTVAGDAVLFRISPHLQHRVNAVAGSIPRTAFAGWFCAEPVFDFQAMLFTEAAARQPDR